MLGAVPNGSRMPPRRLSSGLRIYIFAAWSVRRKNTLALRATLAYDGDMKEIMAMTESKPDVRSLRQQAGYERQEDAARRFEVGLRTWSAWERGEREIPRAVLDLLSIEAARAQAQEGKNND